MLGNFMIPNGCQTRRTPKLCWLSVGSVLDSNGKPERLGMIQKETEAAFEIKDSIRVWT